MNVQAHTYDRKAYPNNTVPKSFFLICESQPRAYILSFFAYFLVKLRIKFDDFLLKLYKVRLKRESGEIGRRTGFRFQRFIRESSSLSFRTIYLQVGSHINV